jgi:hypothetical protein
LLADSEASWVAAARRRAISMATADRLPVAAVPVADTID